MDADKIEKCICGFTIALRQWSLVEASSSDGHSSLVLSVYNEAEGRRFNKGSVSLYACPSCGTIKIIPRR